MGQEHKDLAHLCDIADCFEDAEPQQYSYNEKNLFKWHASRQAAGYVNTTNEQLKAQVARGKGDGKKWR